MKITPIHVGLGAVALFVGYRVFKKAPVGDGNGGDGNGGDGDGDGDGGDGDGPPVSFPGPGGFDPNDPNKPGRQALLSWNTQTQALVNAELDKIYARTNPPSNTIGGWFVAIRDTAMALWPQLPWPLTLSASQEVLDTAAGPRTKWVEDAGANGQGMNSMWSNIQSEVWQRTGYQAP